MNKWNEIEFADVSAGMSTNAVNPGQRFAKRILNLHNHIKPGALVLRSGYEILYDKPECNIKNNFGEKILLDLGFINFDLFFDRQINDAGKEITILIQKAKVHALDNDEDMINMLCFWIRPYWDGNQWIDDWQWLNQTILTKISVGSDILYPYKINILGSAVNGLSDDLLNNHVIYNKTKEQFARIITSKINNSTETRICHTLYNSQWEENDRVIISRYWIDLDYLNELFNVKWQDITFHRILNDIRIGFGGYENRPGIAIGYRKKFFQIRKLDFPSIHPDINNEGIIENLSKIDSIILDTHILGGGYGLQLNAVSGGSLPAGDYTIRLTGIIDNYEEQLLAESNIQVDNNSTIEVIPVINYGRINPRITGYGIYYSNDGITFYKLNKYNITENFYSAGNWKIDNYGRIALISSLQPSETIILELNSGENAISSADANSIGNWETFNGGTLETVQDAVDNYAFKFRSDIYENAQDLSFRTGIILPINNLTKGKIYDVSVYLKSTTDKIYSFFLGESKKVLNRTQTTISADNTYKKYDFNVLADNLTESPKYFAIAISPNRNLFCSAGGTVFSSANGYNWVLSNSGLSPAVETVMIVSYGYNLYAASGNIYKSTNGGISWQQITTLNNIWSLKVINNKIYAGAQDGKIYSSADGITFNLLSEDITNYVMYFVNIGNTIFVATFGGGIYKSIDSGLHWTQVNSGLTNLEITYLHENNGILYAGTFGSGIFKSINQGNSWTAVNNGLPELYISSIKKKDNYLFAALYDSGPGTEAGIYRSSDDGANWEEVNNGITNLDIYDLYILGNKIIAGSSEGEIFISSDNGNSWTLTDVLSGGGILFSDIDNYHEFYVDKLSIKEKNVTIFNEANLTTTEMRAELGYNPTMDIVKGWDKALAFRGRAYYLNPFIDKRYENFILVSHIHSSGSFMYDIASFSNYRELERFDSNEAISMALLPTMDLLILKDNSVMIIDPETGSSREPLFGFGCISKNSVVNMNGVIFWCGGEDIYMYANGQIKSLLKETIRDIYIKIEDKNSFYAIRDKFNSYRIRLYKPEIKTEYLLTENGWIEESKYNFPEIYKAGFRNILYFLSQGKIYTEKIQLDYSVIQDYIMTGEFVAVI